MTEDAPHPVVIFDGECNFCSSIVAFVIKRDGRGVFRFTPFQSETGKALLEGHGVRDGYFDSFILVDEGRLYTKSDAALRLFRRLGGLWSLAYALIVVPGFVRDAVYDFVARNRYRWFGKKDECMIPGPEVRERFLE